MSGTARTYQTKGEDEIRELFAQGITKVLLWLATGAGKTFVFCRLAKKAIEREMHVIIVVRGRKLVDQASKRLFREQVLHGVLMNKHWNFRPHVKMQVCSIDTLIARNLRPKADLIIIDEAHMATSDGYKEFLVDYPNAFVIAVTATPWTEKGLRHVADAVVHPITMTELIEAGYLVPFRYFAPTSPDLSDVKISSSTKDYVTDQLEGVMVAGQLTGKIVDHWEKLGKGRATLCFAVNIHHSKVLAEKFRESGIKAEHCDADTPEDEREEIIKRLESGEIEIICNVGIFCTGVDIPRVSCIIMARPTKSLNLYIQQAGRGTRTFDGKNDCMILDHAGNINQHGFPTEEPEVNLDGHKSEGYIKKSKTCEKCFAVYRGNQCPECGIILPDIPEAGIPDIAESDGELKEIKKLDPIRVELIRLKKISESKVKKPGTARKEWVFYHLLKKFSFEECKDHLPNWYVVRYFNKKKHAFGKSRLVPGTSLK